jgi:2-polyprenyl-3-methyl-5-hydroxy-6-metoxy-1,4-benzoquinol methylase
MIKKYKGIPETLDEIQNIAIKLLCNRKRGKLLDMGAGSGRLTAKLKKIGYLVHACDVEPHHFQPKDIKIDFADGNQKLPYKTKSFDYILAIELIEHLENPWIFIREAHRILKPNGILILSTPNVESLRGKYSFVLGRPLPYFSYKFYKDINHITPIISWNLDRMTENKFKLIGKKYKMHHIPRTNILIKIKSFLFAEDIFYIYRRI